MEPQNITVETLCRTFPEQTLPLVAKKLQNIRLLALQTSPGTFGSTYAREAPYDDSVWQGWVTQINAAHIIASRNSTSDASNWAEHGEWLAILSVMTLVKAPEAGQPSEKTKPEYVPLLPGALETVYFHLNGMFVATAGRRLGLGKKMVYAAVEYVRQEVRRRGMQSALLDLIVDKMNDAAVGLYLACGFQTVEENVTRKWGKVPWPELEGQDRVALTMIMVVRGDTEMV